MASRPVARLDDATVLFRALSDGTRLRVLSVLTHRPELGVGEIVAILRLPQPTVSRHLAYLRRGHLVVMRRDGRRKLYSAAPPRSGLHRAVMASLADGGDFSPLMADRSRARRLARWDA